MKGFILAEVSLAILILGTAILTLISLLLPMAVAVHQSNNQMQAVYLAQEQIERIRQGTTTKTGMQTILFDNKRYQLLWNETVRDTYIETDLTQINVKIEWMTNRGPQAVLLSTLSAGGLPTGPQW